MNFTTYLSEQLQLHPSMQPQDVLKLCYQAARGAEHLLADFSRARAWFDREYAAVPADAAQPLFEMLSPEVARVNLAAWKAAGLPEEWLFRMFAATASVPNPMWDKPSPIMEKRFSTKLTPKSAAHTEIRVPTITARSKKS